MSIAWSWMTFQLIYKRHHVYERRQLWAADHALRVRRGRLAARAAVLHPTDDFGADAGSAELFRGVALMSDAALPLLLLGMQLAQGVAVEQRGLTTLAVVLRL